VILSKGLRPNALYILLSGRVQLIHENRKGRRFIAGIVRAHDFFGELGLFANCDSRYSVLSVTRCDALYIPRAVVLECLKDNARAATCMLERVTRRLAATHRQLAQFALSDVYERVATVLLDQSGENGATTNWEFGAEQLAGLVGCTREMISRVLRVMKDERIVVKRGRTIVVLDRDALRINAAERS
jgi:CRP/FNR family cyclic AMP-dependent transcriptional regulator